MLIKQDERYQINKAAYAVHGELGPGFNEFVYQDALEIEFQNLQIPYQREVIMNPVYKGIQLSHTFRADFVCYGEIIVECKAVNEILPEHKAQLINYLHITNMHMGILLNFSTLSLKPEFLFNSRYKSV